MAITKPPRRYALFANYSTKSVVAILATLNSEVLNVRASTSVTARTEAVELFSDRSAKIDFLLTPVELSSCGLNLQKPCHRGLIVQFPFSANSLSRPFAASSAGPDELDLACKFILQLKREGRIPQAIQTLENVKANYAFDMYREIFGQPYSLSQFYFQKPTQVADFYTGQQHKPPWKVFTTFAAGFQESAVQGGFDRVQVHVQALQGQQPRMAGTDFVSSRTITGNEPEVFLLI
ncbi:hypothetical protein DL546_000978 [Coniochaeta pulveracea]|uniref:Uncharacterized protein n=1 Tax=Coniochaeta pulveracea TaxID=177199 RepID=A0A420XZP6_9PEZI|nr:hypothetical protein DL546_000978 [Coniochaeta pulveracea]